MQDVILIVTAYLIGTLPFGLLLGKLLAKQDVRAIGSGNIGATNVLRTGHKGAAALTLLLDGAKGAAAVWLAGALAVNPYLAGAAALLGHCYPVWLRFKGGKGVATGLGLHLALAWPVGVMMLLTWLGMAWWRRYSSLAALTAFGLSPLFSYAVTGSWEAVAFSLAVAAFIAYRHQDNIRRLRAGTEGKIGN